VTVTLNIKVSHTAESRFGDAFIYALFTAPFPMNIRSRCTLGHDGTFWFKLMEFGTSVLHSPSAQIFYLLKSTLNFLLASLRPGKALNMDRLCPFVDLLSVFSFLQEVLGSSRVHEVHVLVSKV